MIFGIFKCQALCTKRFLAELLEYTCGFLIGGQGALGENFISIGTNALSHFVCILFAVSLREESVFIFGS